MTTKIEARRYGGNIIDDRTLRGYNLAEDAVGQYAVIQHGYACLGTGASTAAALADARRNLGDWEPIEESDEPNQDGAIEVVLIEAAGANEPPARDIVR